MGNAAPRAQPQSVLDSASQYRTFLMDYTPRSMDMMFGSLIGDGKFLKSISCKCDEGHLVVKIYRKYDERESLTSAEVALRRLALAFSVEQQPNVIPYADFQLSNKYNVAFMVRQYFASNLYDRICSRPFLTMVEKKWIVFQILRALEQSHAKGICHGDIKQENVMVTSWNWVFLTDFAPFKPTYIPEDDPADYNYYFCAIDATRRGCSVAPERFYGKGSAPTGAAATGSTPGSGSVNSMKTPDVAMMLSKMADSEVTVEEVDKQILVMGMGSGTMSGTPMQTPPSVTPNGSAPSSYSRSRREGNLLESMDIFSAGCVIAELFLGGKPLFDLPSLLKYRTGDSEALRHQLKKVGDPRLEEMLLHMLQLDPSARLSASGYLAKYTSSSGLFPTYFDNFLFRFLVLVLSRGGKVPDARIRLVCKYYGRLVREVAGVEDPEGEEFFKLRLKEGYGSDRLASATGGDQQTHVAQRVLEELEQKIPTKHDKQKAERDNAALTKLQKIKEKENDMRGLSGTLQKKKIEKLHDQYNALTQKKKTSLLLDYAREPSTGRLDEETNSEDAESKDEDSLGKNDFDSMKANSATPPPHSSKSRRMKPPTYPGSEPWPQDRNGIVIILSLICSSLRHVQVPESKLTALYLIRSLGQFTSDEARLQRLIPYLLEVIDDPSATVRALALRTITYLLSLVESFPLADASVFPQYVLPAMVPFQSDPDELVRITFAECLPQLAETSRRFLEIAHAMKQKMLTSSTSTTSLSTMSARGNDSSAPSTLYMAASSFDKELSVLHKMVSRFVIQLTTPDQKASSSLVKRALLVDITRLCVFFGRERTLDVVLPQLITFLNDPDWELRGAFFDYIVGVCSFVGPVAVEHNILPCIEQALFDVQEIVITKAVKCLTGLCQLGLFQKKISTLVEKARMTCSLLLHPSWWIRDAVLKLMGEISRQLRSVDANVFLSPLLRPFLRKTMIFLPDEEVCDVTRRLRDCCRLHVSRETFDRALLASSSSSGLNEVIAEMEQSVSQTPDDSDDDMMPPAPVAAMTTTSRESLEEPIGEMGRSRKNRDPLLSTDSLDGYGMYRQHSSGTAVASSAAATAETISNSVEDGVSSIYEQRKNEIQSLKLMQQYVAIASMQMRSKLEMAKTEQAARMQGPPKSDRVGSPHSSVTSASVTVGSSASNASSSNPFARKLSRSHLRVLFVPDMRFALSTAQPLKASNFGIPSSSTAAAATSSTSSTSAASTSTALVTKNRTHLPGSSPSHRGGTGSSTSNGGSATVAPSLESLSLSHVGKMYSLVEPSTPISASPITVTGPSSVVPPGSVSSSLDDSGLGQMDSNHFAPTSGGVMVSMLNMNMRDMYGGDGMSSLLDPHHHPVHASPVSPPRQRMIKKAHTTYHHYFAFKESAMDPALGNPRKLLARLNALGIPPLPPDLGALRLSDGSAYSIYSHASSPYCLMGGGTGNSGGNGASGAPGSERGGTSVSSVTSSPIQVGSGTYPPGGGVSPFNAAAAAAAAINGGVTPGNFGNGSNGSNGPGSSSGSVSGVSSGGYPSSSYRNWQPRKNVLVAELAEHSGAVTRVNAAQDYSFLASASNDGTVKIWSVRSLLHSVNQGSRCTYDGQGGVITDMKVLTNSHSVASASSDGTVHVFRVDKVNSVGGNVQASGIKELRANNSAVMAIDYLNNVTEALLLYATRDGKIHAWDLRMRREAWTLSISPELGYVTCITHSLDVSWLAVGTSRGFLCLWDLRFLVLIRIWRHSSHRAIHRLQPCLGLPNTLPLDETSVPLVFVAAGDGEVAVFDLSIGACRAVFRTLEAQASEAEACKCPTLLHVPIPHRSRSVLGSFLGIYGIATAFDEIATSPLSEEPSVRAMLCPSLHLRGIGDALITGGEDRQLRYWDIRNGKQSYTVCGNGESKSFYDNQAPPNDWWRMNPSSSSSAGAPPQRFGEMPAAPMSTTAAVTKPELAWSKLSPPLITVCQDTSFYSSPGGVAGAAASGAGGVESAISMERRGLVPPSPAHTDCILDLTLVELGTSQNPSPMLVSSGRDALIKVWK